MLLSSKIELNVRTACILVYVCRHENAATDRSNVRGKDMFMDRFRSDGIEKV